MFQTGPNLSLEAGADLSAAENKAVKMNSSGQAVLCDTAGEFALGLLDNSPVQYEAARINKERGSVYTAIAGAAVSVNALLSVDTSARLVTASAGHSIVARAKTAASGANVAFEVFWVGEGTDAT